MRQLGLLCLLFVALGAMPAGVNGVYAQTPDLEACSAAGLPLISGAGGQADTIVIADSLAIAETQVSLDLTTAFVGDFTNLSVESAAGTSVQIHAGAGSFSEDFDCIYYDDGDPNDATGAPTGTGVSSIYDCGGCLIQPSGPGVMADYDDELSDGTWTFSTAGFSGTGTLNEWCVRIFLVDPTKRVGDLVCTEGADPGVAEITWTNRGDYDSIDIIFNGVVEATLSGPFADGSAGAYTSATLPVPQAPEVCVIPFAAASGAGPPTCCIVGLPAEPTDEIVLTPGTMISSLTPPYFGVLFFSSATEVADVQVDIEVSTTFLGGLDVSVASAEGTSITLHNSLGGPVDEDLDVTYWELGTENGGPYDCGCFMRPSGPGSLVDFVGETVTGVWIVAIVQASTTVAAEVETVGLAIFDVSPAFPITGLACVRGADIGTVSASWTNGAAYDEIRVIVNGLLEATLPGPFTAGDAESYVTLAYPVPSSVEVCIQGAIGGAPGPPICCNTVVFIDPIEELGAFSTDGTGTATVLWSNPVAYDAIDVYVDGALEATIGGDATTYTTAPYPVESAIEICLIASVTGTGSSDEVCCNALLLESAMIEACETPGLVLDGMGGTVTTSIGVSETITVDEVEVAVDLPTSFVGDYDFIDLESPEGTSVRLHDNNGETGDGFLVIWSQAGVDNATASFVCACRVQPSGPGDLDDFDSELSSGDWTLEINSFEPGVLNSWCVRINGCAILPPADLTCEAADDDVTVTWSNADTYDGIDIFQNDVLVASLGGTATSYTATALSEGRYRFRVVGNSTALACGASSQNCRTAVGFFEVCVEDATLEAVSPGTSNFLTFIEPAIIGEVEVVFILDTAFASNFDFILISPFGTEVQLHNNNGGEGGFNLIWSDAGSPNPGAIVGAFDCAGCLLQPSGPGDMGDYFGEIADGDWELSTGAFSDAGSIELWCLDIHVGCELTPPAGVTCTATDNDIDLAWDNTAVYSSVEITRDGLLVATLAGTAESYTDSNVLGGPYTYRVYGASSTLGCSSGSQRCLIEHQFTEICDATSVVLPIGGTEEVVIDVADSVTVLEVEVFVDITTPFVTYLNPITIESPEGTDVTLYNATSGTGPDAVVTFSSFGEGADFSTSFDCDGCRILPSGPGSLSDFENEASGGTWTLSILAMFSAATLNEWCIGVFEGCDALPPADLTCTEDGAAIELAWTNGQTYDSIDVRRNGLLYASIAGTSTSFTDTAPFPGHLSYRIIGNDAALDCGSRSNECAIAYSRIDTCVSPDDSLSGTGAVTNHELEVDTAGDVEIADAEIFLDITASFTSNFSNITVESPAGTNVQLHASTGGSGGFDVTFSDSGDPGTSLAGGFDCDGCLILPNPGELADFAGELADGTWTLEITTFEIGPLNEWCVDIFPTDLPEPEGPFFLRGDATGNGIFNALLDSLHILNYQFNAGPVPPCFRAADVDGSNIFNALLDALYALNYQFNAGPAPPAPGPTVCGLDPDGDAEPLTCADPDPVCNP